MIRVLIMDDSALVRKLMANILSDDPEIEVVGTAMNVSIARRKIELLQPDVVTLDVEMVVADGIAFLQDLMLAKPLPVVIVSSMEQSAAELTLQALSLGAVDFVAKPCDQLRGELMGQAKEIVRKVKSAAQANLDREPVASNKTVKQPANTSAKADHDDTRIIAIGASTGGTEAIKDVLGPLTLETPGIVISQHIPGTFSEAFAERLNQNSCISVCQAEDGQPIRPGFAYIAPGGKHLVVVRTRQELVCRLDDGPQVNRHKPSVDVMFESVAVAAGTAAVGILLTGMGHDGAEAMGRLQAAGALTIAQDQASSVVWGMPGEAVKRGFADVVLPLPRIAPKVMQVVSRHG